MLTDLVKKSIDESVLCWLATSNSLGEPNCSPKEVFTYKGDSELIIADIASPNSVNNIAENNKVCVSFVHVFKQKGFKLIGEASYISKGHHSYQELFPLVQPFVGDVFPVNGIIHIHITQVSPIIAPAYYLVEGTSEASQIESAKKTYGAD